MSKIDELVDMVITDKYNVVAVEELEKEPIPAATDTDSSN